MSKIEKLSLVITTLELIVFAIGERSVRKRNREFMQRYYRVSSVDELIKKREKDLHNNYQN